MQRIVFIMRLRIIILPLCFFFWCERALAVTNTLAPTEDLAESPVEPPSEQSSATTSKPTPFIEELPSDMPSSYPSWIPTTDEAMFPSPSMQPQTLAPTASLPSNGQVPLIIPVQGQLDLEIATTSSLLIGQTRSTFLETTLGFLSQVLLLTMPPIDSVTVEILGQSRVNRRSRHRFLQSGDTSIPQVGTLFVDLNVTGQLITQTSVYSTFDFNQHLLNIFAQTEDLYIRALKETGDPYFFSIEEVESLPVTIGPPVTSPTLPPVGFGDDDGGTPTVDNNKTPFQLSWGVIAAIGAGGILLIIIIALLCCSSKKASGNKSYSSSPANVSGDSQQRKSWDHRQTETQQQSPLNGSSGGLRPAESSDVDSAVMDSVYTSGDNQSFVVGSIVESETIGGADTMSYAYSLEAGIEPSVASGTNHRSCNVSSIPMEIPQMVRPREEHHTNGDGGQRKGYSHYNAGTSDLGGYSDHEYQMENNNNIVLSPSDLQLTQSELAMLPSDLLKGSASEDVNLITRECYAPPGKLGIVIDTTVEGPVVHNVNTGSPLEGNLWPGDIIVAIDDVDTRAMSASAITALMVKTANQRRKLTIVSDASRF